MPILYFDLTRSGLESTLYHTRRGHANYYTTDAVQFFKEAAGDIHYNQYIYHLPVHFVQGDVCVCLILCSR